MNFLICFNEGYSSYGLTLIFSIIKNNQNKALNFHILTDKLEEKTINRIKNLQNHYVSIYIHNVDISLLDGLKECRHFNKYMYLRLLFIQVSQINQLERIIYLDTDMLCIGDLGQLSSIDIDHHIVGVIEEPDSSWKTQQMLKLGVSKYFNSGFLMINVPQRLQHNISSNVFEFIKTNHEIIEFPDQDALNVVLKDKNIYLSNIYNFHCTFLSNNKSPKIIHYSGDIKPWKRYYFGKGGALYLWYYARSSHNYLYLLFMFSQFICRVIMKNATLYKIIQYVFRIIKNK